MAIDTLHTLEIIEAMENFLTRQRPPEHIRSEVDVDYRIEDQSIIIFEVRPQWNDPETIREYPFAKATFVKAKGNWKVFWMKSDLKWHSYSPQPNVANVKAFAQLVEDDEYGCFRG